MGPALAAAAPKIAQAGLSLGSGIIQGIQAGKLKKKADAAMPDLIDPRQAAFLSELNQKRKAIDTGADFGAGMNAVNSLNSSTNNAIVNASGGDVSGTIQGLLGAQRVADDGINNVIAQGQGQQLAYNSMFNDLNNKIDARQLQLEMYQSQQARAEWAKKKQMSNQNLMAGATRLIGGNSITPGTGGSFFGGDSAETVTPNLTPPKLSTDTNPDDLQLMGNGGKLDTSFLSYLK